MPLFERDECTTLTHKVPNMPDEKCPYCSADVRIDHSEGHGLSESEPHQMECGSCGKTFVFYTTITISHEVQKADCLNEMCAHDYQKTRTYPSQFARMVCTVCGEEKPNA